MFGFDLLAPSHNAASFGHAEVVQLLIKHGADPNAKDNWHFTVSSMTNEAFIPVTNFIALSATYGSCDKRQN